MSGISDFDYVNATEAEILSLAEELPGLELGQIPGAAFSSFGPERGRGEAGRAIEAFFGIPQNSRQEADFPRAGLELKSVPLIEKSVGLRVDQRTVISQVNYLGLADEVWETASVRKKLNVLFVFFQRLRDVPKGRWPVVHVARWNPDRTTESAILRDWEFVRSKVKAGLAHELSEADGSTLGPCTKGADGTQLRPQPFSDLLAKPRAWALKPAFVLGIYEQSRLSDPDYALVVELVGVQRLLKGLQARGGEMIDDLARAVGRPPSDAKDYAARVVHEFAAALEPQGADRSAAFPTIKAPRTSSWGTPYEAVPFPAFRHVELAEESWEDSLLLGYLEHLLFVPVVAERRGTPQGQCRIGPPLYWRPSADQIGGIEEEWVEFRDLICAEKADHLPPASSTRYIHVRPHGRNAADLDPIPGGGSQAKKSFWLNRAFVAEILSEVFPSP